MVTPPSLEIPERRPAANNVAVPSGLSAGYRVALMEALSALGPAGSDAHGRVRDALQALERLDGEVPRSAATPTEAGGRASHHMLEAAEKKAEQAERDLAEKRVPYEADPLFMYLWNRGFGTGAYRASSLVRYFDRKVARLVGYQGARANYATLLELPVRVREHAERLRATLTQGGVGLENDRLAEYADRYRSAIEAADRAYAAARLPAGNHAAGRAVEGERTAPAERSLAEARTALLSTLTGVRAYSSSSPGS